MTKIINRKMQHLDDKIGCGHPMVMKKMALNLVGN